MARYPGPDSLTLNVGGTLYGSTENGGIVELGTVFALNPATGAETVVYSFKHSGGDGATPRGNLIDVGGTLYGTTEGGGANNQGTIFSFDPTANTEAILHAFNMTDGASPWAGLINIGRQLYGTNPSGGRHGDGTVFSMNAVTGATATLHAFSASDGAYSVANLLSCAGNLYGTANQGGNSSSEGGTSNNGTVFTYPP